MPSEIVSDGILISDKVLPLPYPITNLIMAWVGIPTRFCLKIRAGAE
ncbi:hypothetical protein [Neisseria viridiae]|nr:hypothetical protein [Neisseria viridiae]